MYEFCNLKETKVSGYTDRDTEFIGKPLMSTSYFSVIRIVKYNHYNVLRVTGERFFNERLIKYCPICGKKLK